jgi:hypothetical protein
MKNQFMLHVKYNNINGGDKILKDILGKNELNASVLQENTVKKGKEVFYHVEMQPASLIKFKKMVDSINVYESLDLFEYRNW